MLKVNDILSCSGKALCGFLGWCVINGYYDPNNKKRLGIKLERVKILADPDVTKNKPIFDLLDELGIEYELDLKEVYENFESSYDYVDEEMNN